METIVERPGALDVHKAHVTACVRGPGGRGREQHVAEFATTVSGLLSLRDWLAEHGVTQVVMEATGVYWKAPWAILEDEFECLLVNVRAPSTSDTSATLQEGWAASGCASAWSSIRSCAPTGTPT